ncbi:MAG: esterase-like activity of phytase family protein [Saprospiraceae bacterium]
MKTVRPCVQEFASNGVLIERFVPEEHRFLATHCQPAVMVQKRFLQFILSAEPIAVLKQLHTIVKAMLFTRSFKARWITQGSAARNSDVIRFLGVDAATGTPVSEYVYLLERNRESGFSTSRVDKIGDAVYAGNNQFLVLERDSEAPGITEGKNMYIK